MMSCKAYRGWGAGEVLLHVLLLGGVGLSAALTDFSAETEFPSSQHKKYPDTEAVVPYQPSNINVLEIGTNWMFLSWLAPYDGGSTVTHYEVRCALV